MVDEGRLGAPRHNTPDLTAIFEPQPGYVRAVRAFWRLNPFLIFGVSFFIGVLPFLFGVFSPLGSVTYLQTAEGVTAEACTADMLEAGECIEKQVGFSYALNWWPALVMLLPFSLFFAFSSVQAMQRMFAKMLRQGMFCTTDWLAPDLGVSNTLHDGVSALVRRTWTYFLAAAAMVSLLVAFTMARDWYCVVNLPLRSGDILSALPKADVPALCATVGEQEIDWSISAIIPNNNSITFGPSGRFFISEYINWWFSFYVYAAMTIQTMIFLSYFCFIFSLSVVIYQLRRGQFGVRIIPNVNSSDNKHRMGFENFEPVLQPCIFVTVLGFIMAFSMRLQNEYLRDSNYHNIFDFILAGVPEALSEKSVSPLLDIGAFADPNSIIGGPVLIIAFVLVSVVLAFILRRTAQDAANDVGNALEDDTTAPAVEALYGLDREALKKRLADIEVWPLSWPQMNQLLLFSGFGIACFFFYRLAIVWIVIALGKMLFSKK